jgi:hypothetical protein
LVWGIFCLLEHLPSFGIFVAKTVINIHDASILITSWYTLARKCNRSYNHWQVTSHIEHVLKPCHLWHCSHSDSKFLFPMALHLSEQELLRLLQSNKFSLCLTNQALRHEDIWRSGYTEPRVDLSINCLTAQLKALWDMMKNYLKLSYTPDASQ